MLESIGENLCLRNGVAYARWRHGGRVIWQKAPLQGQSRPKLAGAWREEAGRKFATKQLEAWLATWQNDIRVGKWERAHAAQARREFPALGRLLDVYEEIARGQYARIGSPKPATSRDCARRLRLIAEACGVGDVDSISELTPARIRTWLEGRVNGAPAGEEARARYSAWRTIGQARAVWAGWTRDEYRERGIELPACLAEWPKPGRNAARPPAKERPDKELIVGTLQAYERLEQENPALWLAATMLFFFGLRPIDARRLTWADIEERDGRAVLRVTPSKTEGSAGDDRTQEHVLPAGLLERMRAANPEPGAIVPAASDTARFDLFRRDLNDWMRGIGWDRERFRKGAYNFRSLYASVVAHYHGAQVAATKIGDNVETAKKFYVFSVDQEDRAIDPVAMIAELMGR